MKGAIERRLNSVGFVLATGLLAAMPAFGGSLYLSHDFQTSDQGMWGAGTASSISYTDSLPFHWAAAGGSDGMSCILSWCAGSSYAFLSSGSLTLNSRVNINGGSISASLPTQIDLHFPAHVQRTPGETPFTVSTRVTLAPGQMRTISPTVTANFELFGSATAMGYGIVCWVSDCAGFAKNAFFDAIPPIEVASVNRNNDGLFRVLGQQAALPGSGTVQGVTYTVAPPDISASGTGLLSLISVGTSDLLDLKGTLVNVAGSAGSIDYMLLSAGLGVDIGLTQVITFTPFLHISLDVAETGQTVAFDTLPFLQFESPQILFPDNIDMLHITPTFTLDGLLTNTTMLTLDASLFANGLSIDAPGGLSAGPLLHASYGEGPQAIALFRDAFTLGGFDSFAGPTFIVEVPEPGSLLLLSAGLMCIRLSGTRRGRSRSIMHAPFRGPPVLAPTEN